MLRGRLQVCQFFCVNDQVLFLGMGCRGRGLLPLPLPLMSKRSRCHPAILSRAGIRSGHSTVKWLSASRQ